MRHFCLALNHHEKTAINLIVNVLIDSKFSVYGTVDVLHDPSSQATVPIRLSHLGDVFVVVSFVQSIVLRDFNETLISVYLANKILKIYIT